MTIEIDDNKIMLLPDLKKFPISRMWKNHILDLLKHDFTCLDELEEAPSALKKWKWLMNTDSPILKRIFWIIETMSYMPALTIRELIARNMLEQGNDGYSTKEYQAFHKKFSLVLEAMIQNEIIQSYPLSREDVGKGKLTCSIFFSPFAGKDDIERCKNKYIGKGGVVGRIGKAEIIDQNKRSTKKKAEDIFFLAHCSICGFDESIKYEPNIKQLIKNGILNEDEKRLDQNIACSKCQSTKSRNILDPEVFL